jgi:ribosomal protein S18 acetylase RimI-like enzyme
MMTLRPATIDDVPALATLGRESFVVKFGNLYGPADLEPFLEQAYSEKSVARDIADPERSHCLAEEDGKLVGFCKLGLASQYASYSDAERPIDLMQLYCDPAQTGRGIGARLMHWALDEARQGGADAILLSVFSENFGAQRFYERYGFSKIADIDFWVGKHRDDEFLFELRL